MRILWEDNSFIEVEESDRDDKFVSITMCGINQRTKRVLMTTSELDKDQLQNLVDCLQKILKKY